MGRDKEDRKGAERKGRSRSAGWQLHLNWQRQFELNLKS